MPSYIVNKVVLRGVLMFRGKTTKALTLALALWFSGAVQAVIVDHGPYLTDTSSGLDWLDVTSTVNISFNDVTTRLGVIGDPLYGWRYATGIEFNGLISNYTGYSITHGDYWVDHKKNLIDGLVVLLGSTLDTYWIDLFGTTYDASINVPEGAGVDTVVGLIEDYYPSETSHLAATIIDDDRDDTALDRTALRSVIVSNGRYGYDIGSFLVRPTIHHNFVPEPATLALTGLGLASLSLSRRRKTAQEVGCSARLCTSTASV